MDMVEEEEWHRLNDMDELLNGLKNKDLLAGFETLKCCFPPTYKVQKGTVGFHYNKKRIPRYVYAILPHQPTDIDVLDTTLTHYHPKNLT